MSGEMTAQARDRLREEMSEQFARWSRWAAEDAPLFERRREIEDRLRGVHDGRRATAAQHGAAIPDLAQQLQHAPFVEVAQRELGAIDAELERRHAARQGEVI